MHHNSRKNSKKCCSNNSIKNKQCEIMSKRFSSILKVFLNRIFRFLELFPGPHADNALHVGETFDLGAVNRCHDVADLKTGRGGGAVCPPLVAPRPPGWLAAKRGQRR